RCAGDANRPWRLRLGESRRFGDERPRSGAEADHGPPAFVVGGGGDLGRIRLFVDGVDGGALERLAPRIPHGARRACRLREYRRPDEQTHEDGYGSDDTSHTSSYASPRIALHRGSHLIPAASGPR